ncbi:cytochrome-c oxidase, cbb3-type subunit III [Pseudomonas sp. nanlin1]|uniref:cytochrome-c oxidase, cbb3-type subunit III n=1 Tax=Pseudomonas sp. nanlin1 TaxID=3040605 RepID=UPI00388F9270
MSTFWSLYISVLTLGTLAALAWLLFSTRKGQPDEPGEEPLEHSFDGIQEYDNPLPRWWFLLFIATLLFALGYLALYPGLGNFKGWLPGYAYLDEGTQRQFANGQQGWSAVHEWEKEMAAAQTRVGPIFARLASLPIETAAQDPQALEIGARLFASNCALCHGSDAKGGLGYPNLTDSDWRWGGTPEAIKASIYDGRHAVMPAWGAIIGDQGVADVSAYVSQTLLKRSLPSDTNADASRGANHYATLCVACHGAEGKGNALLGAPDLTNPTAYLYGTRYGQLQDSIRLGRQGVMPAQAQLQGDDRVHVLAAYVYSLSRQEAKPPAKGD